MRTLKFSPVLVVLPLLVLGLIFFQNCGQGFQSGSQGAQDLSSSQGSNNDPFGGGTGGTATPTPTPAVSGTPTPTPLPTPVFKNQWTAITSSGLPNPARYAHIAVWTGTKMLVWGGYESAVGHEINTGGLYDPTTNTWDPTSTTGAPTARAYASGVWTGTQLIVWGGETFGRATVETAFNTGGIYDPATNTWKAISTTGAPSARAGHVAVWTGTKMIVYGGLVESSPVVYRNDGGIYDPVTNTWTAISATGAPTNMGGLNITAAWTGTKMIVFGMDSGGTETGALYDPAANTWTAMNKTGMPSRRVDPGFAWTGTKLVVVGGYYNPNYINDGAVYDPATNTWEAVSTNGFPTNRFIFSGTSDGKRAFFFGGQQATADANSGGIYDLETKTWTAIPAIPASTGFSAHSAVWTGSAMIILGNHANPAGAILQ